MKYFKIQTETNKPTKFVYICAVLSFINNTENNRQKKMNTRQLTQTFHWQNYNSWRENR